MGQYYNILIKDNNENYTLYDRSVNKKYMLAKLTEHSWIRNSFMDSFCNVLINNPVKIAWVGDYADEIHNYEIPNNIDKELLEDIYNKTYKELKSNTISYLKFDYDKYLLVNHTKKIYIDLKKYIEANDNDGWCLHPLSLLTALGNGLGGGDYHGINENLIGSWAWDKISLENKLDFNISSYEQINYYFQEA